MRRECCYRGIIKIMIEAIEPRRNDRISVGVVAVERVIDTSDEVLEAGAGPQTC